MNVQYGRVQMRRVDENQIAVETPSGLDIRLFANERVAVDRASLAEIESVSEMAASVTDLESRGFFGGPAAVRRCVFTPDFHKGPGIPVGTVLETDGLVFPRIVGGDIGCGMRLEATDVTTSEFEGLGPSFDRMLRHACFEGGRDLPLSGAVREAMLRLGTPGLLEASGGLWDDVAPDERRAGAVRSHRGGSWPTKGLWCLGDYARGSGGVSRDAALGTVGGGNHFVEFQRMVRRPDPATCYRWGLAQDRVAVMIHTGSLGIGGMVADHFMRLAQDLHPAGVARPPRGFHPLPLRGPLAAHGRAYLSAMGLAANFAAANRLALGLMAVSCLSRCLGRRVRSSLVYDAPHNLAWAGDGETVIHRKGACPAESDMHDPAFPDGIPVIVPGSMGAESWVMKGLGGEGNLRSAPHGAGRTASRGEGRKGSASELAALRVVTKVDPLRVRRDLAAEAERDMLEEAPSAYKSVAAVVDTCAGAGIAVPVAVLRPLLTVKG